MLLCLKDPTQVKNVPIHCGGPVAVFFVPVYVALHVIKWKFRLRHMMESICKLVKYYDKSITCEQMPVGYLSYVSRAGKAAPKPSEFKNEPF
jgi:hypothetical protein